MLKNWNSLPECMRKEEVKKYYKELSRKRPGTCCQAFSGRGSGTYTNGSFVARNAYTCNMYQAGQQWAGFLSSGKNYPVRQTLQDL